jgi:Tfp pilus assembly protein FimT
MTHARPGLMYGTRRRSARGVRVGATLLELVVALVVTGVMATIGTSAFSTIIDHRQVIRESAIDLERAAALRETLRGWLVSGQVQIQQGGGPRGRAAAVAAAAPSALTGGTGSGLTAVSAAAAVGEEVTFVTTAASPATSPNVRIRLFIDGDANTPETGLTIEYQPSDAGTQVPLQRRELEPNIGGMLVEFLDQRTVRWVKASEGATITPTAVRITLLAPDRGTIPAILSVPIVLSMRVGQ